MCANRHAAWTQHLGVLLKEVWLGLEQVLVEVLADRLPRAQRELTCQPARCVDVLSEELTVHAPRIPREHLLTLRPGLDPPAPALRLPMAQQDVPDRSRVGRLTR